MLFGRFSVRINDAHLKGEAWGEVVDREKHQPIVEVKGATYTELKVGQLRGIGAWIAQAVLDV